MKWPFSLISTAFLSSRRQSSNAGRFSCFIGGAIVNVPVFGKQEGPLDAVSSGGVSGAKTPPPPPITFSTFIHILLVSYKSIKTPTVLQVFVQHERFTVSFRTS
jgi:hypothetical protein